MNAAQAVCASSGKTNAWEQLNWTQCERQVRRLQARIVKATQEGRWNKVKALQRLLTCSFSGKALAVKRVTDNQGKRTPGVDGVLWRTPASKHKAIGTLQRHGYKPQPLRRVHIPKANGKSRPLGIPTMKDRAMQALYLLALSPVAETTADRNSYGFRAGRSTADAITQSFHMLCRKDTATWVLEGDIRGCFDNINHEWMLRHVPTDKDVLRKWLQAGFMEDRILFPTEAGTPQGGIISPTLANLTLDGLERLLREEFPPNRLPRPKVNLIRYADDFIITGSTKELLENEVRPLVEQFLLDRGLQLSPEKTCITHIETGFDFLGQNLRKFSGRLLIQPSKNNTHALLEKMRQIIRRSRGVSQTDLIRQLNPVLRGWAFYHRHSAAKRTYKKVEWALWHSLLRWGKHRHNNKSSRWVFQKYWHSIGGRNEFAADSAKRTADGKIIWLKLYKTTDTSIRRHPRLRGEANPFDPRWRAYFEDRAFFKRLGIRRREAGLEPSSASAPPERRGFAMA
jgi:RNA-directed DNA polymerase